MLMSYRSVDGRIRHFHMRGKKKWEKISYENRWSKGGCFSLYIDIAARPAATLCIHSNQSFSHRSSAGPCLFKPTFPIPAHQEIQTLVVVVKRAVSPWNKTNIYFCLYRLVAGNRPWPKGQDGHGQQSLNLHTNDPRETHRHFCPPWPNQGPPQWGLISHPYGRQDPSRKTFRTKFLTISHDFYHLSHPASSGLALRFPFDSFRRNQTFLPGPFSGRKPIRFIKYRPLRQKK